MLSSVALRNALAMHGVSTATIHTLYREPAIYYMLSEACFSICVVEDAGGSLCRRYEAACEASCTAI